MPLHLLLFASGLLSVGRAYVDFPSSCVGQENGYQWVKPLEGDDFPPIYQKCDKEYMIIDLAMDPNVAQYFTSLEPWHYAISGPSRGDAVNWEKWWLPNARFLANNDIPTGAWTEDEDSAEHTRGDEWDGEEEDPMDWIDWSLPEGVQADDADAAAGDADDAEGAEGSAAGHTRGDHWDGDERRRLGETRHRSLAQYFAYALSPDCASCDATVFDTVQHQHSTLNDDAYGDRTAYFMTGPMFGCGAEAEYMAGCQMDYDSYHCPKCTTEAEDGDLGFKETDFPELYSAHSLSLGSCGVTPMASYSDDVPASLEECSQFEENKMPSIGTDGRFCVCYRPHDDFDTDTRWRAPPSLFEEYQTEWEQLQQTKALELAEPEPADEVEDNVVELTQQDFVKGTYRITRSGTYKVMEDIAFDFQAGNVKNPNAANSWFPKKVQQKSYPGAGGTRDEYHLGFFAGITVECNDVVIDLNGHELAQSQAFYFQQRFFSVIALKSVAFPLNQGNGFFGAEPVFASNVVIKDGSIGLSSHHGIHGHSNEHVTIENVHIHSFETHGVQMSHFHGLKMTDVEIGPSSTTAFLKAEYGFARWTLQRLTRIANDEEQAVNTDAFPLQFEGRDEELTLDAIVLRLKMAMDVAFKSVSGVERYAEEDERYQEAKELFINEDGVPYGAVMYGLFLNQDLAATHGDHPSLIHSDGAVIEGLSVHDLSHKMVEYVRLDRRNQAPFRNPMGGVIDAAALLGDLSELDLNDDGSVNWRKARYRGDVLTDAFVALEVATAEWGERGLMALGQDFVDWTQGLLPFTNDDEGHPLFGCNNDAMGMLPRGVVGVRMDGAERVEFKGLDVYNLYESGDAGSELCGEYWDGDYSRMEGGGNVHQRAPYLYGFTGNMAHGLMSDWSSFSLEKAINVHHIYSKTGLVRALGLYTKTEVIYYNDPPPPTMEPTTAAPVTAAPVTAAPTTADPTAEPTLEPTVQPIDDSLDEADDEQLPDDDEEADPVDQEPVDEEPVDEQPVDEEPVDEQPEDAENAEPEDEEPVDEPVGEEPEDAEETDPEDEDPVDEEPVDEEPEDEHVVGDNKGHWMPGEDEGVHPEDGNADEPPTAPEVEGEPELQSEMESAEEMEAEEDDEPDPARPPPMSTPAPGIGAPPGEPIESPPDRTTTEEPIESPPDPTPEPVQRAESELEDEEGMKTTEELAPQPPPPPIDGPGTVPPEPTEVETEQWPSDEEEPLRKRRFTNPKYAKRKKQKRAQKHSKLLRPLKELKRVDPFDRRRMAVDGEDIDAEWIQSIVKSHRSRGSHNRDIPALPADELTVHGIPDYAEEGYHGIDAVDAINVLELEQLEPMAVPPKDLKSAALPPPKDAKASSAAPPKDGAADSKAAAPPQPKPNDAAADKPGAAKPEDTPKDAKSVAPPKKTDAKPPPKPEDAKPPKPEDAKADAPTAKEAGTDEVEWPDLPDSSDTKYGIPDYGDGFEGDDAAGISAPGDDDEGDVFSDDDEEHRHQTEINIYYLVAGQSLFEAQSVSAQRPHAPAVAKPFHILSDYQCGDGRQCGVESVFEPQSLSMWCVFGSDGTENDYEVRGGAAIDNSGCFSHHETKTAALETFKTMTFSEAHDRAAFSYSAPMIWSLAMAMTAATAFLLCFVWRRVLSDGGYQKVGDSKKEAVESDSLTESTFNRYDGESSN